MRIQKYADGSKHSEKAEFGAFVESSDVRNFYSLRDQRSVYQAEHHGYSYSA